MPGEVKLDVEPLFADGSITLNGKTITYGRAADPSVLCDQGQELFRQWQMQAVRHATSAGT